MSKSAVPSTYAYQNRTSQHQPPMLPSQSPFIARHHPQHSGSCAGLPPSAAVPPHFHYAPVHHHPQQGLYVGGGQSAGARCASRQCDVTSMPPPTAPSTSGDNMAELNPFQLMASTSYTHRYNDSIFCLCLVATGGLMPPVGECSCCRPLATTLVNITISAHIVLYFFKVLDLERLQ